MAKARRVEYALSSHIAAYKDSKEKDKQKVAMGARPPHYEQLRRNRYDGDITRPAAPGEDDAFFVGVEQLMNERLGMLRLVGRQRQTISQAILLFLRRFETTSV